MDVGIKLELVSQDDLQILWEWRNHPEIRKNFFNSDPIPFQTHQRWFWERLKDPGTKMYIAKTGTEKIGVIRFKDKKDYTEVSVNLGPDFLGKGLGTKIIVAGTQKYLKDEKGCKQIFARIKKENIASQKAFEKAGYKDIKREMKKNFLTFIFQNETKS